MKVIVIRETKRGSYRKELEVKSICRLVKDRVNNITAVRCEICDPGAKVIELIDPVDGSEYCITDGGCSIDKEFASGHFEDLDVSVIITKGFIGRRDRIKKLWLLYPQSDVEFIVGGI